MRTKALSDYNFNTLRYFACRAKDDKEKQAIIKEIVRRQNECIEDRQIAIHNKEEAAKVLNKILQAGKKERDKMEAKKAKKALFKALEDMHSYNVDILNYIDEKEPLKAFKNDLDRITQEDYNKTVIQKITSNSIIKEKQKIADNKNYVKSTVPGFALHGISVSGFVNGEVIEGIIISVKTEKNGGVWISLLGTFEDFDIRDFVATEKEDRKLFETEKNKMLSI